MRVGVKYCGGCNPEYRREVIEEMLKKHFEIFYSDNVEILVLISGCKRACVADEIDHTGSVIVDCLVSEAEVVEKVVKLMESRQKRSNR